MQLKSIQPDIKIQNIHMFHQQSVGYVIFSKSFRKFVESNQNLCQKVRVRHVDRFGSVRVLVLFGFSQNVGSSSVRSARVRFDSHL